MKKKQLFMLLLLCGCVSLIPSCIKQNRIEPLSFEPPPRSDQYYAALRAYKKSDHAISFAWWGRSGLKGNLSPDMAFRYEGLPDSMDIISMWGKWPDSTHLAEMISVRERKGTRFVGVTFTDSNFVNSLARAAGIITAKQSFKTMYDKGDSLLKVGFNSMLKTLRRQSDSMLLDGYDFDHEPNFCQCNLGLFEDQRKFSLFLIEASKYFGPLSGSDKLLIVDGEYAGISPEAAKGLDYIVTQSYGTTEFSQLQSRYNGTPDGFPTTKFVVTENMQKYGASGRSFFVDEQDVGSLIGMAMWNPKEGRKGGFGSYILETDAAPDGTGQTYLYTRRGIQIQNPAKH